MTFRNILHRTILRRSSTVLTSMAAALATAGVGTIVTPAAVEAAAAASIEVTGYAVLAEDQCVPEYGVRTVDINQRIRFCWVAEITGDVTFRSHWIEQIVGDPNGGTPFFGLATIAPGESVVWRSDPVSAPGEHGNLDVMAAWEAYETDQWGGRSAANRGYVRVDVVDPAIAPLRGPGGTRFVDPDSSGAGTVIEDYRFRPGWTSITDVDLDGDGADEIFYYNGQTGLARFVGPGPSGAGRLIADYSFRRGWTSVTNVDLDGDGADEILYYDWRTGFARFVDPNLRGAGRLIADYGFRRYWDVTNVDLDGDGADEVLYYDSFVG